jgi:DNA repair exonuclease SbcCD ATPase subunit
MKTEDKNGIDLQHLRYDGKSIIELQDIYVRLEKIRQYIERETDQRQLLIERQAYKIEKLKTLLEKKDEIILNLESQLKECSRNAEGNRQLINKLLTDIGHYQNDIEWYKRTYEKRSFWGVIKEKLHKKS